MAKIVYGVSGEGSGHSSRAREMINHLQQLGHIVKVVSYDRGYRNLKEDFDVFETEGLHIASSDNRVSKVKTFTDNLQRLPRGHKKLNSLRKDIFKTFWPDCVITDFELLCAYLAHHYDLPLITIDNQHRIRYMTYPCPARLQTERRMTVSVIRAMVPRPDISLVTTFYYGINLRRIRSEAVGSFLYRVLDFNENLNDYQAVDNSAIQNKLAELLDNNCARAKEYHLKRK